jgi:alpha-amylase
LFASFKSIASTKDVLVQLFEWKWDDISRECLLYLPALGISGVQISPPNEHAVLENRPWYERYQPVSYILHSRSGDEQSFRKMVQTCNSVGINIYADVVINHTAWNPSNGKTFYGIAGSPFGHMRFPDFSSGAYFNQCRNGVDHDSIRDWNNRFEVQFCNLAGLPDLKTSDSSVQNTISGYLEKLASIGVKGLRIDAAKHIPFHDLKKIVKDIFKPEFVYQEVVDMGGHEVIVAQEYFGIGKVNNFRYGRDLGKIFSSGALSELQHLGDSWGYTPSEKSVVFVDNHDTQRGHGPSEHVINYKAGPVYKMATAFMLAWPYGQPILMSSYHFDTDKQGPPDRNANISDPCFDRGWICEHRFGMIPVLTSLRKKIQSPFITGWWSGTFRQIAFSRDNKYLFIFNRDSHTLSNISRVNLESGTYINPLSSESLQVLPNDHKLNVNVEANSFKIFMKKD